METFYQENKNFAVIDLGLNVFRFRQTYQKDRLRFDTDIMLNTLWVENLRKELSFQQTAHPNVWIGINMEYIHSCQDREAFTNFTKSMQNPSKVFFYNILSDSLMAERMTSDLESAGGTPEIDCENGILYLAKPSDIDGKDLLNQCERIVQSKLEDSVRKLVSPQDPLELLASSNIYADHYVNVKRLFMNPDELYLIIYYMSRYLMKIDQDYQGLVASSKNGAVLAALLGRMIGKDVVYCVNVGPQYALPIDAAECIQSGKKYVYVCDFICMGTEVKLLHAVISNRKAILANGIGVANYIPLDNLELEEKHSPLARMYCLVDLLSAKIPYNVYLKRDVSGPKVLKAQ